MLKSIDQAMGSRCSRWPWLASPFQGFKILSPANTNASHANVLRNKGTTTLGIQWRWHADDPFVSWKRSRFRSDVVVSQQDKRQQNAWVAEWFWFDLALWKGMGRSRGILGILLNPRHIFQMTANPGHVFFFYVPCPFFVGTPTIIQSQECSLGDGYDNQKKNQGRNHVDWPYLPENDESIDHNFTLMISPWTGHDITNASYDMVSLCIFIIFHVFWMISRHWQVQLMSLQMMSRSLRDVMGCNGM